MKKILIITILSIILLGLVGGWFYWFQWRPSKIRQGCNKSAIEIEKLNTKTWWEGLDILSKTPNVSTTKGYEYSTVYTQCLREQGIK